MSNKNFMAYGDAETVLTGFANDIKTKASEAGTESLVNSTVGWTGKNLCNVDNVNHLDENGINIVIGSDKKITANGTAGSGNAFFLLDTINVGKGKYYISGGADGGSSEKYKLYVQIDNTSQGRKQVDLYSSSDRILIENPDNVEREMRIQLKFNTGVLIDNVVFAPMVTLEAITDPTYEPYHKSVEECKADNTVIAPVENGETASRIYSIGEHFIKDGAFCTAIVYIAAGTTLALNTNYTVGTVDVPALKSLNGNNLNNINAAGLYLITGSCTNAPDGVSAGFMELLKASSDIWVQNIYPNSNLNYYFMRRFYNGLWGDWIKISDSSYLETTATLSTSSSTTVTFTDSSITANSFIEYACSVWDLVPESITGAAGSCTIVLPKVDSAQSVTVRIYVR